MLSLDSEKFDYTKKRLVDRLFSDRSVKRYILGRNESAKKLSKVVDFDAFIDDFSDEKSWLNKRVCKSRDIDKNSIVVSCSLAIYPHSALKSLRESGIEDIVNYLDVMKYSKIKSLGMEFLEASRRDIRDNFSQYEWLYSKVGEDESKRVLVDILNFRKNMDISYLKEYRVDSSGQYFEDFLDLSDGEVFVDVGGYDGETSREFINQCPNYNSIYIFEPSKESLSKAKDRLRSFKNIYFIQKGLSDKREELKFNDSLGSANTISKDGGLKIVVDALDNLVKQRVTFIKMDIEGVESLAIKGCVNHIKKSHPKLAICVYHKPDDLWKIPKQIFKIRDDYSIYLRHYSEGIDETVMFFIPKYS